MRIHKNDELGESLATLVGLLRKDFQSLENLAIMLMKDKIDRTIALRTEEFERLSQRIE